MATKPKRMSVYKTMMRRRAFTNWSNLLLRSIDKQIVDIFDANERELLDRLLDIVLQGSVKKFKETTEETRVKQRGIILEKAESFKGSYLKGNPAKDVNRPVVIQFIWDLIEYFHISPGKHFWENENNTMNAKEILLKWINGKLPGRNVQNFTTDWNDGILLCELVNALEPGLVSARQYQQGSWPQRNVTVAMETAEKAWGIPDIISSDDMISGEVDELSVMAYVSLFFEYDLQRLSTNHGARMNNGHVGMSSCENDFRREHTTVNNEVKKNLIPDKDDIKVNHNADNDFEDNNNSNKNNDFTNLKHNVDQNGFKENYDTDNGFKENNNTDKNNDFTNLNHNVDQSGFKENHNADNGFKVNYGSDKNGLKDNNNADKNDFENHNTDNGFKVNHNADQNVFKENYNADNGFKMNYNTDKNGLKDNNNEDKDDFENHNTNTVFKLNHNADKNHFTSMNHVSQKTTKSNNTSQENIEKNPEIGGVGKFVEYILDLHNVNANEIIVSVECKATGRLGQQYKPDLKVFSLGKGKFRVKYTPNVAGNYRLSLFYQGEHIGDSPYCLKVPPVACTREKGDTDTNNNPCKNHGNKPQSVCNGMTEEPGTIAGYYGFDGDGLKRATVGKLAVFTVITDNRDKGPLSICINCPAVSIPVPHVKTTHSLNYSTHTIAYMPTLAGTYNIFVRWGLRLINGSPFHVDVTDHDVCKPKALLRRKGSKEYDEKRQSTEFSHIKVYHSSSSLDSDVISDTADLEVLLARYGLTNGSCNDTWVSVDVELEKDERELIFRLAGTRRLPLVFIHEQCLGGYKDVYNLDEMNELERRLRYKVRKV